jgi:hypothetical protein
MRLWITVKAPDVVYGLVDHYTKCDKGEGRLRRHVA